MSSRSYVRWLCLMLLGMLIPAAWGADAPPWTVDAAVASALEHNPTARAAFQQMEQARARLEQARAQQRLQLSYSVAASGSNGTVATPPPDAETFATVQNTLTAPIPIGSRPRWQIAQAEAQAEAARAQYDVARRTLAGQVGDAYYDVLRKQALLQQAEETRVQAERQLSEAEKRSKNGDVAALDVLRAQVPRSSAEASVIQAQSNLGVARQTLNGVLGQALESSVAVIDVSETEIRLPFASPEESARIAVQRSADVRAADAAVRAAAAAVALARSGREPQLSLQASDARSGDVTGFTRLDTLQATLTLPLTDGGLVRQQVREAEAALLQAREQAVAARRLVELSASNAWLTASGAIQQIAAARLARDVAATTYEKTRRGYQLGLFPITDVLNALTSWTQARIAYTQTLYDAAAAVNTLRQTIQGVP